MSENLHAVVLIAVVLAAAATFWRFGRRKTRLSAVAESVVLLLLLGGIFVFALPAQQCGPLRVSSLLILDIALPLLTGAAVFAFVDRSAVKIPFLGATFLVAWYLAFQTCHFSRVQSAQVEVMKHEYAA